MKQEWHDLTYANGDVYVVAPGVGGCQYLVGNRTLANGINEDNVRLFVNAARLLAELESVRDDMALLVRERHIESYNFERIDAAIAAAKGTGE